MPFMRPHKLNAGAWLDVTRQHYKSSFQEFECISQYWALQHMHAYVPPYSSYGILPSTACCRIMRHHLWRVQHTNWNTAHSAEERTISVYAHACARVHAYFIYRIVYMYVHTWHMLLLLALYIMLDACMMWYARRAHNTETRTKSHFSQVCACVCVCVTMAVCVSLSFCGLWDASRRSSSMPESLDIDAYDLNTLSAPWDRTTTAAAETSE